MVPTRLPLRILTGLAPQHLTLTSIGESKALCHQYGLSFLSARALMNRCRYMASRLFNCPPTDTQRSAVNAIISRQESLIAHLRGYQEEDEREHRRLAANGAVLERSARSVDMFRNIGTGIRDQLSPVLITLDQLLSSQTADHDKLSTILPSTKTLLTDWAAVRHTLAALLSTLQAPMKEIEQFVVSIADELDNTEMLKNQFTDVTTTLSEMIQCGLQSIKSKKRGILHPLRCIPDEIMLQIFWECIKEEQDGLRQLPLTENPHLPSTLAAVCKRWRNIVLHTPHFWSYICAPSSSWDRSRLDAWERVVFLAKHTSLEMTVSPQSQITLKASALRFHRLNITNAEEKLPPNLPSPHHLWIRQSDSDLLSPIIPANLISSTFCITCVNILPRFEKKNQTVGVMSIKGAQSSQCFRSMMNNLPRLQELDMAQLRIVTLDIASNSAITHGFLSHLAIHASALGMIDYHLALGLRLPALRRFSVGDIEDEGCSASEYPSIVSQFKPTITDLEFSGFSLQTSVLSWIEALLPLKGLVTNGEEATLVVLDLLFQPSDSETNTQGAIQLPPKGLMSLVIREYMDDGTSIQPQLEGISRNPHPNSQPIRITFERCPNILPSIRAELSRELENGLSEPEITAGPV